MIRTATAVLALVLPALAMSGAVTARAAAAEPPETVVVPGANGAIVFARSQDGLNYDIYRRKPDGTGETRLTNDPASEMDPSFSPDRRYIVYTRFGVGLGEIYRMNADGSDQVRLAAGSEPSWSPDGEHIVFAVEGNGDSEIHRMNADGTGQIRLTDNTVPDGGPSYSPDGQHIVFTSSHDLSRMDADGSNLRTLLDGLGASFRSPAYSPDGRTIVYFREHTRANYPPPDAYISSISSIYTDGSPGPIYVDLIENGEGSPSYSPDGQYVVFHGASGTYRIHADNTGLTLFIPEAVTPSWGSFVPCQDLVPTVAGTAGTDLLTGGPGADVIFGYGGDDTIDGRGGADVICGGPGTDTASYATHELDVVADLDNEAAADGSAEDGPPGARDTIDTDVERLIGGYGDDTLTGGPGVNVLTGGPGDDTLTGGAGSDTLFGSSGDDTLLGEAGNDALRGLTGQDVLDGGADQDSLDGGNDADLVDGGPGVDTVTYASRVGAVVVRLGDGAGDDGSSVDGPRGHRDTLAATVERAVGGRGNDTLIGSPANNRLTGGPGADDLRGLGGVDTLVANDGVADVLIDCGDGTDAAAIHDAGLDPSPVSCP